MRELIGALTASLCGLPLFILDGRLVAYKYLLTTGGETALAEITETGAVRRSSGGYVDYVRYRFRDPAGKIRNGGGCSGVGA